MWTTRVVFSGRHASEVRYKHICSKTRSLLWVDEILHHLRNPVSSPVNTNKPWLPFLGGAKRISQPPTVFGCPKKGLQRDRSKISTSRRRLLKKGPGRLGHFEFWPKTQKKTASGGSGKKKKQQQQKEKQTNSGKTVWEQSKHTSQNPSNLSPARNL